MQLILNNEKLVKYIFNNNENIVINDNFIKVSKYIIYDLNKNNSTIVNIENLPNDFVENKYFYINESFILNENWVDPNVIKEEDNEEIL